MIKIMTYNIQHGIDHLYRKKTKNSIVNLDGVVEVIKKYDPDIVGLNEVYDAPVKDLEKQAKYIADKLGYYYFFGRAIDIKGGHYGNALLSKYTINNPEVIKIDDPIIKNENEFYESRSIIKSSITIDKNEYIVMVSHFGLAKSEQLNATNKIIDLLKKEKNCIFVGDLNMERENPNIQRIEELLENTIKNDEKTFPSDDVKVKIDYIFIDKNFANYEAIVLPDIFSDHLPILVKIM